MNKNSLVLSQKHLAEYVSDAVKLENAIYTLQSTINIFEVNRKELEEITNCLVSNAQEKHDYYESKYATDITNIKSIWYIMLNKGTFWVVTFGFICIFGVITLQIIAPFLNSLFETTRFYNNIEIGADIINIICIFISIVCSPICSALAHFKGCKEEHLHQVKHCEHLRSMAQNAREQIVLAKTQTGLNKNKLRLYDAQIAKLNSNYNQLIKTRTHFYNSGIIPPDYRTFDCVIILNQIFRNDLADTMREAIKIYEDRVFRGEVVRGIDTICSMLDNLSVGMAIIGDTLKRINSNIRIMSEDFSAFADQYTNDCRRNQEQMDELINETKLSRYAQEELAYYRRWDFGN